MAPTRHAIDRTVDLDIDGSRQRIRLCGDREGRPPLLVVQAGPGLPLLNEVAKFQRLLGLERDFLVAYWEQRGCGNAARRDTERVSLAQQVTDLRAVLRWLFDQTRQPAIVLAISLGGTIALRAADDARDHVKVIVAVSPDSQTAIGDAAADVFIRGHGVHAARRGVRRRAIGLSRPPYLDPAALQRRARLLADLGAIERGRTFAPLLRELSFSLLRTYGVAGAVRALRNMNLVQQRMLAELNALDLVATPPRVSVPVHYVFGGRDALNPPAIVDRLPTAIAAPKTTVTVVPDGAHMVHFDHPDVVRSIVATI
jgi:pimeloyl-ACP methyl ester carboxylesterase